MKKIISLLIVIAMLACALLSCGGSDADKAPSDQKENGEMNDENGEEDRGTDPTDKDNADEITLPSGMSGADAIRLLLANERLGDKVINESDGIFAGGEKALRTLAARAEENSNATVVSLSSGISTKFSPLLLNDRESASRPAEMTEFDDLSRNYEEFASTTETIIREAEAAADMIKFVKSYIRILDTWVKDPSTENNELYLHVEENSETIFNRASDSLRICHRYKNELGKDVYEIYSQISFANLRFTYIEGEKYEMIYQMDGGKRYQGLSANNSKGYWEIFNVVYDSEYVDYKFNTNFIIMKNDICYNAGYSLREDSGVSYTVTTSDRTNDVMQIEELLDASIFDIKLAAFSGYYGVVDISEGNLGSLKLADGRLINCGDIDASAYNTECQATVNSIYAAESAFGREGGVMLMIREGSPKDRRDLLVKILAGWGITCKYDINKIFAAVDCANDEFVVMRKYLKWNGHDVNSEAGLMAGVADEKTKFDAFVAMYDAVKSGEAVSVDSEIGALLVKFAEISEIKSENVSVDGLSASIGSISLSVKDMLLFDKNEKYKVSFAMKSLGNDGGLTHIEAETSAIAYDGGESITVSASNVKLTVPMLSAGDYTLVAYIATEDGIRSSSYKEIGVASIANDTVKQNDIQAVLKSENGALKVSYTKIVDVVASIESTESISYTRLYELMSEKAFEYGVPSEELIKRVDPQTKEESALNGAEENIENGTYVISYTVTNGEDVIEGRLYVEYTLKEVASDANVNN